MYSSNNQPCMASPALVDLNPDKGNHGLRYYLFTANVGKYIGSSNTFDDPSGRMCVPNKMENRIVNVFKMITINYSKIFQNIYHANVNVMVQNVIQIKSGVKTYVDVIAKIQ